MTEQQQHDAAITETIAAQLRNEIALRRACEQARAERPEAASALLRRPLELA
jgi:hypothetical protein